MPLSFKCQFLLQTGTFLWKRITSVSQLVSPSGTQSEAAAFTLVTRMAMALASSVLLDLAHAKPQFVCAGSLHTGPLPHWTGKHTLCVFCVKVVPEGHVL